MSKTLTEIATSVLQEIGRLPDNQVAPESQIKKVTDAYDGLYEELLNNELVNWSKADDVPDFATRKIIIMLSGRVANNFGVPDVWSQLEDLQLKLLSQQLTTTYVHQPTQFENF